MNAEIIAIGSELLLGETIDTNSAYLARQLTGIGINLFRKTIVGDNEARIVAAIDEALNRADLIICTGGLGPTVDDMTRPAIATATGRPLEFHQHLLDQIEARFRSFGRTMSPSNRQQAYVPQGARIVENPRGTAPSFIVEDQRGTIAVLPGVPSEMRFLWENALLPYLRDERGETSVILVKTLHAAGQGESVIGEMVADLMAQDNPTLGISAKRAQYELRIGAKATTQADAEALVAQAEATIRERLGQYLIGTERLDTAATDLIKERGLTLAVQESDNHAPVFRALMNTAAGPEVLIGDVVQPPRTSVAAADIVQHARAAATFARDHFGADLGIGVQHATSPGADNFTQVAVALAHAGGVLEWTRGYDLNIGENWETVATSAFDGIRQFLSA